LRIEQIERDRVAAEEAEARRVEAEAQRVAEAQQALLAAQEAERQEREAAAELERARLQAEEVERARVQKLRQKIKNLEDTNIFLRTQAGTEVAIASNMKDIARLQAEIQGQPAGAPPAYDAPVVPAPSPSPSPPVPAYQPPGGPPPPTYVAPVVATPAPAPLTSLEGTARMLGIEQVNGAGSIGLSADMLQCRLQSQFGFSQFTANDLVRVVGAQPHPHQHTHPHPLAYPLPR
jgi:multidrug efflux pump subunit AcrA (membrane-fusion protein)